MTGKTRSSLLSLAIIAVLLFGALSPTVAYADDSTPPDTPPVEANPACTAEGECPSSEDAAQPTSEPIEVTDEATSTPAEDEVTTDPTSVAPEATAEATSTPDEAPAEAGGEGNSSGEETAVPASTEEAAPVAEQGTPTPDSNILGEIPADTTVTVVDAQGQAEPLATQDAADAIATSDPIWCPAGQSPTPGANGCTASFTSFDDLLTFLSGNAAFQGAGTIYVQQGAYNGGEASIDFNSAAYDLSNIRNSDLTVTGGWNTTTNVVDPAGTSTFTIPIIIGTSTSPWGGSLFVNNITINNTDGTGLTLHAQNEIVLVNVNSTNSVNGAGAELNAGGDVTMNNSKFDRNKTAGAIIRSGGNVAIANSSFSNPANARRQITGLDILSNGSVALLNVLANENREEGADINAGGRVTISSSFFSGTKAIKGSGTSTEFLGYGLRVVTPDAIDLAGVEAINNFLWGASLDNCKATDTGICTGSGDVAIADSIFNANTTESPGFIDDTGLLITTGGRVALNNVQANDNRLIGATIKAVGDVAINNSIFSRNNGILLSSTGTPTFYGYGLQVVTLGSIAVNLVTASDNTLFGAHLDAGGDVAVSNSNFNNQTSGSSTDQTGRGLEIISGGNVFLSSVVVDNNQTFGANIEAGNDVFLDTVTATNNGLDGVDVQTSCNTVFLIDGTYSNNGQFGLSIVNSALDQSGSPVFAGNGAGDIFHDPGTCVFTTTTAGTGNGNSSGAGVGPAALTFINPVQVALQSIPSFGSARGGSIPAAGVGSKNLTLNSFLAHTRITSGGTELSIFVGQFAYIHSDSGVLYIIALSPSSHSLAMDGS